MGTEDLALTMGGSKSLLFPYRQTNVGDLWIDESKIERPGGAVQLKVTVAELKDGLVHRELSWVVEPFEAPEWRQDIAMPLVNPTPFEINCSASVDRDDHLEALEAALGLLAQGELKKATETLYDEDAVIELPQSGECFVGLPTIVDMLTRHPAAPKGTLVRSWSARNLMVAETSWRYAEEEWGDIALYEFHGGRVTRATEYFF